MLKKVFILADSFKGSITSKRIASKGEAFFRKYLDPNLVKGYSISDGGEGTVQFFIDELGFKEAYVNSVNAYLKPLQTKFAYQGEVAVFDVASIVGFDVNDHLDILHVTSYGIGLVLKEIISQGFKKIYLGLGGSITNDGGSGLLEALGVVFYDGEKEVRLHQNPFSKVSSVDLAKLSKNLNGVEITGLSDVKNPLLGSKGATSVFGPQKGATITNQAFLEDWMTKYASLFTVDAAIPGAGAAGGLGFSLLVMNATLKSGLQVMLESLPINNLDSETLLITGEGCLDETSFSGKVVGQLVEQSKRNGNELAIICGINCYKAQIPYRIFAMHKGIVSDFKATVENDLDFVFCQIFKTYFLSPNLILRPACKLTDKLRKLRYDVFVTEQHVSLEEEFDGLDDAFSHFEVCYFEEVIGGARVMTKGHDATIGRILVKEKYRRLGVGSFLMKQLMALLKEEGIKTITIHAQTVALGFYEQLGFTKVGKEFEEAGIMHYQMILEL